MSIRWAPEARDDIDRLADFVVLHDRGHADIIERDLSQAPRDLLQFPRRGPRLSDFDPREVREYRAGRYLLRYELRDGDILVLRFFHAREDRF